MVLQIFKLPVREIHRERGRENTLVTLLTSQFTEFTLYQTNEASGSVLCCGANQISFGPMYIPDQLLNVQVKPVWTDWNKPVMF